jgi:hypothetical protein
MHERNDCRWILLATSEHFSFCRCGVCRSVRIEFGNVVLRFLPEEYSRFVDFVAMIDVDRCARMNTSSSRCVAVDFQDTGITVTFTRDEIDELRDLIEEMEEMSVSPRSRRAGRQVRARLVEWTAAMLN